VIDVADFNDEDKLGKGKEMIDRLSKLVGIFEKLNLSSNQAEDDDLLGDAYEYLMRHFATESGKSKGQFYTPAEVSRIMAKIIGISADCPSSTSVYDPTCGSGSLLLKAAAQANNQISLYGQEKDVATASLARMNMILHNNETAEINTGNTLSDPSFRDERGGLKAFDFAVANPPFSSKNWTSGITPSDDPFERFSYGIPPEKNGDYAFLLHLLKSLKPSGKGAIILPHGVLFRGNAEARIRTELLNLGLIKGIIGLPANLFYGTGIPACIIVIDKEHAQIAQFAEDGSRQVISGGSVFMIDASRGFIKDGNKNRLREQDIHKIIDTFTKQEEIAHYSRMVHLSEIAAQDYNLNLPRYIDSGEVEDLQDLAAHLYGGIPAHDMDALEAYWQVLGRLKNELFAEHDGRFIAKIESSQIKAHILAHPDYAAFKAEHLAKFAAWHTQNDLAAIQPSSRPSELIQQWSESLLGAFKPSSLIEEYDFYQILMDYWAETLQDDVYLIAQDGWPAVKDLAEITKESDEAANLTVVFEETETDKKSKAKTKRISKKYRSEVIAPELIAHRYFSDDLAKLEEKQSELERLSQELENHLEEHSGEESVLNDVLDAKGKLSAKLLKTALEENDIEEGERAILQTAQTLMTQEKTAKDAVKTLSEALNLAIFKQFGQLSEEEIKQLVVHDKWLATLQSHIENRLENSIQQLISRLNTLENRYRSPMAELAQEVEIWQRKVDAHLKNMGFGV
jgi:type I restriction-modification enzyme subunit M